MLCYEDISLYVIKQLIFLCTYTSFQSCNAMLVFVCDIQSVFANINCMCLWNTTNTANKAHLVSWLVSLKLFLFTFVLF